MKARVCQLHKTEAEWQKYSDWSPEAGEIVVYDKDATHNFARMKVGDGKTQLKNLPFFIEDTIASYIRKIEYQEILDGGRIAKK